MTDLVTRTSAQNAVGEIDSSDPAIQSASAKADAERVEVSGRKEFFGLRKTWSAVIIVWITALIVFNLGLTVAVGAGWLDFLEYQWFIVAVTVETFLQIVGMGFIAVKFLFSE